jgi:hypothetical protein
MEGFSEQGSGSRNFIFEFFHKKARLKESKILHSTRQPRIVKIISTHTGTDFVLGL